MKYRGCANTPYVSLESVICAPDGYHVKCLWELHPLCDAAVLLTAKLQKKAPPVAESGQVHVSALWPLLPLR